MVKLIPARIENGHVVPEDSLPRAEVVRSVCILLEIAEPTQPADEPGHLLKWFGILKGYTGDPKEGYRKHLEEKYLGAPLPEKESP
jgi:hypothetical protein